MQAAIYCRSSKDRAEVGLDAQRGELKAFAKAKGLTVAAEFSDMEISGSLDETSRPGLREMLIALRARDRKWNEILALDTSRIARDPMLGLYITREAEKHGVAIHYAKMPVDGNSAFGETMLSVVRAFDRLHARLSAEKGREGLNANIAKGFRAGGAAPFGYKLQHKETGGMRGGVNVRKSTLILDPASAAKVKVFLQARAEGVARHEAARRAGLDNKPIASLIGFERNALTYAGYTVWNQRRKVKPNRDDPRKTMHWRPQSEWVITEKPTHAALITRAEAERILALHSELPKRAPRAREPGKFILSGMLFTPDDKQWHGDTSHNAYRAGTKGRRLNAPYIEGEILYQLNGDFADPKFLARTIAEARRVAAGIEADPAELDVALRRAETRLTNILNLGADSGDTAVLAKARELEATVQSLREQKAEWAERKALKDRLTALNEKDLRNALLAAAVRLRGDDMEADWGWADLANLEKLKPEALRHVLTTLVERIELDPKTLKFTMRYRLPIVGGVKVASPRGFDVNSLSVISTGGLRWRQRTDSRSRHSRNPIRNTTSGLNGAATGTARLSDHHGGL